jgi:putative transposase
LKTIETIFNTQQVSLDALVVWVDQGYSGKNLARAIKQVCGDSVQVEVIERKSQELEILPKWWIVERTFGWLNRFRRSLPRL